MPKIDLIREFNFEASHSLPWHQGKCKNLHGHTYRLFVTISQELNENGVVMEFYDLKTLVNREVIDHLDHKHLNDLLDNPTAENIALWVWDRLKTKLPLKEVSLGETRNCTVRVYEE